MKNFVIKTTIGNIQIDADELPKYLQAKTKRSVVLFRQGVFDGNLLSIVVEDRARKHGQHIGYDDRTESNFSNEKPLPDLFVDARKKLDALAPASTKNLLGGSQ